MGRYLTPTVFRNLGTGLPLDAIADLVLAGWIAQAEAQIDAFCSLRQDQGLGFAAGSRTERHPWDPVHRRVYPDSFPVPVRSVQSMQVVVSQTEGSGDLVAATVDPTLVVINNDQNYLEPVSLSVIAFGLTPVIAQLSILQVFSLTTYTAAYQIVKTAYPLIGIRANVFHSLLPQWDLTQPVTVYVGGVAQVGGYTVNAADGSVTFTTAPLGVVTADFTHTIPENVVQAATLTVGEAAETFFARSAGLAGFSSVGISGQMTTQRRSGAALPAAAMALLAPYKRLNL